MYMHYHECECMRARVRSCVCVYLFYIINKLCSNSPGACRQLLYTVQCTLLIRYMSTMNIKKKLFTKMTFNEEKEVEK